MLSQIFSGYEGFDHWILPVAAVDKLIQVTDSWDDHDDDIDAVASTSELGLRMFSTAVRSNVFNRVKKKCEDCFKDMLDNKALTTKLLSECRKKMLEDIAALVIPEVPNRVVVVTYLGQNVKVKVDSAMWEAKLRLNTYVKNRAHAHRIRKGNSDVPALTPLYCELDLARAVEKTGGAVDSDCLKEFNAARRSANACLSAHHHCNGVHIIGQLDKQEDVLALLDDSVCVEIAWFRFMAVSGVQSHLQDDVLQTLPSTAGEHDANLVAEKLNVLKQGSRYKFGTSEAQSSVNIVAEWCLAIAQRRAPPLGAAKQGEWLWSVRERLAYFCFYKDCLHFRFGRGQLVCKCWKTSFGNPDSLKFVWWSDRCHFIRTFCAIGCACPWRDQPVCINAALSITWFLARV